MLFLLILMAPVVFMLGAVQVGAGGVLVMLAILKIVTLLGKIPSASRSFMEYFGWRR